MSNQRKQVLVKIFREIVAQKTIEKLIEENITREGAIKFFLDPLNKMEISAEDKQELTCLATLAVNIFFDKQDRKQEGQNILNQLKQTENDAIRLYKQALKDIMEGKNLVRWESDVDSAIKEINALIEKSSGKAESYEKLKNELYALKYLIAERN